MGNTSSRANNRKKKYKWQKAIANAKASASSTTLTEPSLGASTPAKPTTETTSSSTEPQVEQEENTCIPLHRPTTSTTTPNHISRFARKPSYRRSAVFKNATAGNRVSVALAAEKKKRRDTSQFQVSRKFTNTSSSRKNAINLRLVMLGAGDSGKTTILKQSVLLWNKKNLKLEKLKERSMMNVMESIYALIQEAKRRELPLTHREDAEKVVKLTEEEFDLIPQRFGDDLVESVSKLWQEESIQLVFKDNSTIADFVETTGYWMESAARVAQEDYQPTAEDVIHQKAKTTGVSEHEVGVGRIQLTLVDVGGQRNERRKWPNAYWSNEQRYDRSSSSQDVNLFTNSLLLVISLSEYDQFLYEDGSVNRAHETLELMEELSKNNKVQMIANIFVIFTKKDVFLRKAKIKDLSTGFKNFKQKELNNSSSTPSESSSSSSFESFSSGSPAREEDFTLDERYIQFVVNEYIIILERNLQRKVSQNHVFVIDALQQEHVKNMMQSIVAIISEAPQV